VKSLIAILYDKPDFLSSLFKFDERTTISHLHK
jgi:hypothetical protein